MKIPILILTHTRISHLKKCIESLLNCPESLETELFISSDQYRDENEKILVSNVREYIENIKGFKKVIPVFFEKNVGSRQAFLFCIKQVFKKYDTIILSEDDNVFSPLFLTYMNKMMNYYKNDKNVFAISGFSPNVFTTNYSKDKNELFKSRSCAVWGFSFSKENYMKFSKFFNDKNLLRELKKDLSDKSFKKKLNKISLAYYPHFLHCVKQQQQPTFDHLISYYCLKHNLINIHSLKTYVKNYGHDGSGLHNKKNKKLQNIQADFAVNLPRIKMINDISFREDLIGKYAENKLFYWIKVISIKLRLFNILKKFSNLI